MKKARVIYHKNCYDGFAAAWCIREMSIRKGCADMIEYVPYQYNEPIPETKGFTEVFIVDMSFKKDVLLEMCDNNDYVYLFDHHKTAEEDLRDLEYPNLKIIFDMNRSGAMITRDFIKSHIRFPKAWYFIDVIGDRDLWKWELPHSRELNAYIRTIPFDFIQFDRLCKTLDTNLERQDAIIKGELVLQLEKDQQESLAKNAVWIEVFGFKGVAVNAPIHQSELGNMLLGLHPEADFAACYTVQLNGEWKWSLRSEDSRADVSAICKRFRGGGHRNAAGCINLEYQLI